jgi:hypothetical protein
MQHAGIHNHPWAESKKCDPLARSKLEKTIAKNPLAGAYNLKVCPFLINIHLNVWVNLAEKLLSACSLEDPMPLMAIKLKL